MRKQFGLLNLIAGFVLLLIGGFAAMVAYGIYANDRAERRAAAFCSEIAAAGRITAGLARAERDGIRYHATRSPDAYDFLFPGWVFNAAICRAEVDGDAVRSTRSWMEED